ncbi:histidine phosphatase family protein [Saccharopolyspora sp. NPDC050389]|uniref:histidine phosphatase family protein n=1 Tax=Saccharopolyspora sp. NPDC050389 TaxID=3155516 RepID=UPI0033C93DEE
MTSCFTYLLRHAPTVYSVDYRVNGDPVVDVPMTDDGVAACQAAKSIVPIDAVATCVASTFDRCVRTAELITAGRVHVHRDARLNELDYGACEGGPFLTYARWLAEYGPHVRPPGARESQAEGIVRMLTGLRATLGWPGPRLVVAHGLLVSVIQWAQSHPHQPLTDVFLPAARCLTPLVIGDADLRAVIDWFLRDLDHGMRRRRGWHVDLGVFPREARDGLATVSTHASVSRDEDEATHA